MGERTTASSAFACIGRPLTRTGRWVTVPRDLFERVVDLCAREDRDMGAQVFDDFGADRFRNGHHTACKAAEFRPGVRMTSATAGRLCGTWEASRLQASM